MNEFWERNRHFLTQVLGAAGVFLVLSYVALRFGAESDRDRRDRERLIERGTLLQRQSSDRAGLPEGSVAKLDRALGELTDAVCITIPGDLAEQRNLATHFLKRKAYECARLDQIAEEKRVNVKVNLTDVDFHQRDTDDLENSEEHWGVLASLSRLMEAVFRSGFSEVLSVVIEGTRTEPVTGDPTWSIVRYGVTVELVGHSGDFMKFYAALSRPKAFLRLETETLRPRQGGTEGELQGSVTGWGVRLVKTKERAKPEPTVRRYKR